MKNARPTYEELERELQEAKDILMAIRNGAVDTIIGGREDVKHLRLENLKLVEDRERLLRELQEAMANIKTLSGLLPICAWCKKIRDDKGYWNQIETYLRNHSEVDFSHGICPQCIERYHPEA